MRQNRLCYISRNYYNLTSAGNKAKTDNEDTLSEMGATNLGLSRTVNSSKILAFFLDLAGIIRACILLQKNDVLFLQYPVKKYFSFLCNVASMKGAKTVSLIQREYERLATGTWIRKANRLLGTLRLPLFFLPRATSSIIRHHNESYRCICRST